MSDMAAPTPTTPLTWAAVIPTRNRHDVLALCLQQLVRQTRPPTQIIVVDASDDWQPQRERILPSPTERGAIRWRYEPAQTLGSCAQRNQGLRACDADIAFLIDDDSLLYPDTAEKIMQVYEADAHGCILGVQAAETSQPPTTNRDLSDVQVNRRPSTYAPTWLPRGLMRWLRRELFMYGEAQYFVPYDADWPDHPLPDAARAVGAQPARLLHGFRMTFRRKAITEARFEELLQRYACGEDLDASYRLSRRGALAERPDALIYHHTAASGRLNRQLVSLTAMVNRSVLHRLNSSDPRRSRRRLFLRDLRQLLAEGLKDTAARRLTYPQFRGAWRAFWVSRRIQRLPADEVPAWFTQWQQRLFEQTS